MEYQYDVERITEILICCKCQNYMLWLTFTKIKIIDLFTTTSFRRLITLSCEDQGISLLLLRYRLMRGGSLVRPLDQLGYKLPPTLNDDIVDEAEPCLRGHSIHITAAGSRSNQRCLYFTLQLDQRQTCSLTHYQGGRSEKVKGHRSAKRTRQLLKSHHLGRC